MVIVYCCLLGRIDCIQQSINGNYALNSQQLQWNDLINEPNTQYIDQDTKPNPAIDTIKNPN
jgi:hypothetical protein